MAAAENSDELSRARERTSLEHVREILFGAQTRDIERRLARLDARLTGELATIREELRRRFADLEEHVRGEIEAMSTRVEAEATARVDAHSLLAKETREKATALELRVNRMDEASARDRRELRRQILEQSKELDERIATARQELMSSLDTEGEVLPEESSAQGERESLH